MHAAIGQTRALVVDIHITPHRPIGTTARIREVGVEAREELTEPVEETLSGQ